MSGKKKAKVLVEMIPTEGSTTSKEVEVASGATVEDALKAAGIDTKNKNFEIDGNVVKLDAKIAEHARKPRVTAREQRAQPAPRVTATERVSGS